MSIPIVAHAAAPLIVAGAAVQAGTRARLQLDLIELADGAKVRLPVVVINGANPGPRLYVDATITR